MESTHCPTPAEAGSSKPKKHYKAQTLKCPIEDCAKIFSYPSALRRHLNSRAHLTLVSQAQYNSNAYPGTHRVEKETLVPYNHDSHGVSSPDANQSSSSASAEPMTTPSPCHPDDNSSHEVQREGATRLSEAGEVIHSDCISLPKPRSTKSSLPGGLPTRKRAVVEVFPVDEETHIQKKLRYADESEILSNQDDQVHARNELK